MSPRKKSKPNPAAPADGSNSSSTGLPVPADGSTTNLSSSAPNASEILQDPPCRESLSESAATTSNSVETSAPSEQSQNKSIGRKWLGSSGSWRSKAPAIVKTAKESIGSSGGTTTELPSEESKKPKDDSPTKFLKKRSSSKGDAIPASMTKLNVSSDGAVNETQDSKANETTAEPEEQDVGEPPLPPDPPKNQPASTFGWRSWWSRPDGYSETAKTKEGRENNIQDAQNTPLPGVTPSEDVIANAKQLGVGNDIVEPGQEQEVEPKDIPSDLTQGQVTEIKDAVPSSKQPPAKIAPTSWFRLWSSAQNAQSNPLPTEEPPAPEQVPAQRLDERPESMATQPAQQAELVSEPTITVPPAVENTVQGTRKPTGWAFWFSGKEDTIKKSGDGSPQKHVGEVAVFDTPSQSHPEAAQFNEQEQPHQDESKIVAKEPPKPPIAEPKSKISFRSLRGRPKVKDTPKDTPTDTPSSGKAATPSKSSPAPSPTRSDTALATQLASKQDVKTKQEPPNLILPEFKNTYRLVQQPSFWKQIRQYFLGGESAMPHLHINPVPPRIKKAVAIGVHGFFPAPIIQRVLGQPTGTSIRFANAAATAIKDWTEARGYTPEIEQVALEGEGFIAERVNTLWKLLLNWIEHIKAADFILVACHSQGVPVAIMLVAKLIQFGCVSASRIGICAMAGVNMGPFIEYKTKYFGPTAAELFEFSNPKSLVSQMYLAALDEVLRFGVRVLYVGSIDDQLVSLESSTFSTLSHPYIYRAVFVDGRIHAPDFLSHLVGFTLKLRNLGLPDHGLIRELSPALAGSLYAGEGHSRVYEDPRVYELAIHHALETTSLPVQPQQRPSTSASFQGINIPIIGEKAGNNDIHKLRVKEYENTASANQNPFFLPWAMRGLLEEDFVKKELGDEVEELLNMFESWKPQGKLKDVKFRLEGVRSKL